MTRSGAAAAVAVAVLAAGAVLTAGPLDAEPYRIRSGDTLSGIADRLGVPLSTLIDANSITDPNRIVAGEVLVVPSDGGWGTDYVVRAGDNLTIISQLVGVSPADLMRANGIRDPNHVEKGRILAIPGLAQPGAGSHTVRPGQNLTSIAARHGVTPGALAATNGLANPDLVYAGQVLTIPGRW